ncbi:unnamed protein product, partial [Meganyctiphanes norvegica]
HTYTLHIARQKLTMQSLYLLSLLGCISATHLSSSWLDVFTTARKLADSNLLPVSELNPPTNSHCPLIRPKLCLSPSNITSVIYLPYTTIICLPGETSLRTIEDQCPLTRPKLCPNPSNITSVIHLPYTTVICLPGDNSPRTTEVQCPLSRPKICPSP